MSSSAVFEPLIIILSQTVQLGGIAFIGVDYSSLYSLSLCSIFGVGNIIINLFTAKFK